MQKYILLALLIFSPLAFSEESDCLHAGWFGALNDQDQCIPFKGVLNNCKANQLQCSPFLYGDNNCIKKNLKTNTNLSCLTNIKNKKNAIKTSLKNIKKLNLPDPDDSPLELSYMLLQEICDEELWRAKETSLL